MIDQITAYLGANISYALGWTIIHSLWQVSLLALIMSIVHKAIQTKSSEAKYIVSLSMLILSLILSVITFIIYFNDQSIVEATQAFTNPTLSTTLTPESTSILLESIGNIFNDNLHHINTIWIIGSIVFALKFILSYSYIKYIRVTAIEVLEPSVLALLEKTKKNIGINKAIRFAESSKINVPMILGHLKPIILFPIGMINMLTTKEIEAIIAHELFHIKRNDYIVNITLTIIEIFYFYHPAMWWISANIKSERENCCDDAAINYNIDSVTYAKVLVKLEEMRNAGIPSLAMPFASNKHHLLNRIKRILNMEQTKNDIKEKSVATVLLLFIAILFASNTNSPFPENEFNIEEVSYNSEESSPRNKQQESNDTLKLNGHDEIIVDIKKSAFSSLSVDDQEIEQGEIVNKLKSHFSNQKLKDEMKYDQRFSIKGNPNIIFENEKFSFFGDQVEFENGRKFLTQFDTLPQSLHHNNDSVTIKTDKNGKQIEVTKQNGEITKLKIDGKTIPESEYSNYQDDIDDVYNGFTFELNDNFGEMQLELENLFDGESMDSIFSNSFGMMFDGKDWREFGGNIEQLLDKDVLKNLENFRMPDFEGLERLENLEHLENLEGLEGLEEALEKMGIQLDSSMKMFNFEIDDFEGFDGFQGFEGFDGFKYFGDENMEIRDNNKPFGSNTVVDKLGSALNRDGLLEEYKSNKIELSGKHLKINGEKMPKALFNKYKNIYQEETGAPLTKKSKMVFDVEGKPSKRKVRSF